MINVQFQRREKVKKFSAIQIKDIVLLSFGSFGVSFMLSVYSLAVPRLLVENRVSSTLLNISIFSELVMFTILGPFFGYLFDITRTAIGRRTPYILSFAVTTAFLVAFIQKNPDASTKNILSLAILFNFSLLLYSIAFFGLVKDKITYQTKFLIPFHVFLWGFIGVIVSYVYMLNSEDVVHGIQTPVSGFVFLLSALCVSFFIIEDRKYKTKLSKTELGEYRFNLKNLFMFSDLQKKDLVNMIIFGIIFSHEIFTVEYLSSYSFKNTVIAQFVFSLAVGLAYCLYICSNRVKILSEKSYPVPLFLSVLYFLQSFLNMGMILLFQFIIGFLWGLTIPKTLEFIVPSRAERLILYRESLDEKLSMFEERKLKFFLLVFIVILSLGISIDFAGLENANLVYSVFTFSILILELGRVARK